MKCKLLALAIIPLTFFGLAHAHLSDTDLAVIATYQHEYQEVPDYIINAMKEGSRNNLQSVEDYMKQVTYWDGQKNLPIPPLYDAINIPVTTPVTTPVTPPATTSYNASVQATQNQPDIENASHNKRLQIHETADRQHQQDQRDINTAAANTLLQTETLDTEQAKDIGDNTTAIADNKDHIEQVEHDSDAPTRCQNQINTAINNTFAKTEVLDAKQSADIKSLANDVQQNTSTSAYAKSRADAAYANTEANRQALQTTNHRVADNSMAIADHEQRIEKLEANNSANFGKLKNGVDDNLQRASAAISGVAAMANIPQIIQDQTFSVGAGVGTPPILLQPASG